MGRRLNPVTAEAEVEVKKASMKDSFRVAAPGINNKVVPIAINTSNPVTSCMATGNWWGFSDLTPPRILILRCLRIKFPDLGFWDWEGLGLFIPGC